MLKGTAQQDVVSFDRFSLKGEAWSFFNEIRPSIILLETIKVCQRHRVQLLAMKKAIANSGRYNIRISAISLSHVPTAQRVH
jgi:hypothetical protein